jgi:hypothetical protein
MEMEKMRSVETILRRGEGRQRNITKTYCKHFCKCHNVPPGQQQYNNKNKVKMTIEGKKQIF